MKRKQINRFPSLPIYKSDYKPITKMQLLGFLMMILSGAFCIMMIYVITFYHKELKEMFNTAWSVILINKTAGGFTILFILTVVYFVIVGYSKRENF